MGNARSVFDYPQNGLRRFSADTPHRTVCAVLGIINSPMCFRISAQSRICRLAHWLLPGFAWRGVWGDRNPHPLTHPLQHCDFHDCQRFLQVVVSFFLVAGDGHAEPGEEIGAPLVHRVYDRNSRLAKAGQGVFSLGWNDGIDLA